MGLTRRKPKHLPFFRGPYLPGCSDVMVGYLKEGLFMRMYYPTDIPLDTQDDSSILFNYNAWTTWIPDSSYLKGLAKVLMIFPFLIRLVFWWCDINLLPAIYGAKAKTEQKLKCVIMSHGLGAHRNFYTNTFCELASRGFLVVSVEHRDNSAGNTYYYKSKEDVRNDNRAIIDHLNIPLGKDHYRRRNEQVHYRSEECSKVLDLLVNLNKGEIPYNILDDLPTNTGMLFKLADFEGKLDLDNITMMGHSFGGATALLTLSRRPEFKCGVLLDPWMFCIKDEDLHLKIKQPLQFINTQTFHLKSNVKVMEKFIGKNDTQMCTILHTTHEFQTDTVLLIGSWLNWFMRKLDPEEALIINNCIIMKFLHEHVGLPENVDEMEDLLKMNKRNIEYGLTKPWA